MRIAAFADIHGRPERVARVRALVLEHSPHVVLLAGDLTHADVGQEALDLLGTLPVPVLALPGNMDGFLALAKLKRHGKITGPKPVVIDGFSFGGPNVEQPCDVLVTHEPPQGTLDLVASGRHIGSEHVLELMRRHRPRLLACGHAHEAPGVEQVGETLVVNCSMGGGSCGGALIELLEDKVSARLL